MIGRKWRTFRRLAGAEQRRLLRLLLWLPLMTLALRLLGFRRLQRLLMTLAPPNRPRPAEATAAAHQEARSWARLMKLAARYSPLAANCLPRSLTLWWLLRRRAIPGELRIGVRQQAGQFEAHAWVELDGQAIDDDDHDIHHRFEPFTETFLS